MQYRYITVGIGDMGLHHAKSLLLALSEGMYIHTVTATRDAVHYILAKES